MDVLRLFARLAWVGSVRWARDRLRVIVGSGSGTCTGTGSGKSGGSIYLSICVANKSLSALLYLYSPHSVGFALDLLGVCIGLVLPINMAMCLVYSDHFFVAKNESPTGYSVLVQID